MISLNWIKDYVNIDGIDPKELASKITKAGINVEHVIYLNNNSNKTSFFLKTLQN